MSHVQVQQGPECQASSPWREGCVCFSVGCPGTEKLLGHQCCLLLASWFQMKNLPTFELVSPVQAACRMDTLSPAFRSFITMGGFSWCLSFLGIIQLLESEVVSLASLGGFLMLFLLTTSHWLSLSLWVCGGNCGILCYWPTGPWTSACLLPLCLAVCSHGVKCESRIPSPSAPLLLTFLFLNLPVQRYPFFFFGNFYVFAEIWVFFSFFFTCFKRMHCCLLEHGYEPLEIFARQFQHLLHVDVVIIHCPLSSK